MEKVKKNTKQLLALLAVLAVFVMVLVPGTKTNAAKILQQPLMVTIGNGIRRFRLFRDAIVWMFHHCTGKNAL